MVILGVESSCDETGLALYHSERGLLGHITSSQHAIHEKYGGIIQGIYDNNNQKKFVYSFDIGICSNGILDCYKLTKENKYIKNI